MEEHDIKLIIITNKKGTLHYTFFNIHLSFCHLHWQKLMINDTLSSAPKLQMALIVADVFLSALPKDTTYQNFELR